MGELEHCLTQQRKEIDQKDQFRESRRIEMLGRLLYEKRVTEAQLRGIAEDKLAVICSCANFVAVLGSD